MSDTTYNKFQHYGTASERAAFTPSPPAGTQPIYIWYETDTNKTFLYHTTWIELGAGATVGTHGSTHQAGSTDPLPSDLRVAGSYGTGLIPALTGDIRLPAVSQIKARNAANTDDVILIQHEASGWVTLPGTVRMTGYFEVDSIVANNNIIGFGYLALGTNVASTGAIRLPNAAFIAARNAANTADLLLWGLDAANNLVTGAPIYSLSNAHFDGNLDVGGIISGDGSGLTNLPTFTPTAYYDYVEGTPSNPPADTLRLYAVDYNGFTFLEERDSSGRTVRTSRDTIAVGKVDEAGGVTKGDAVYVSGATGANRLLKKARADSRTTTPAFGLAMESGAFNSFVRVLTSGLLTGLNTSAIAEGTRVFLSETTAGTLTTTPPLAPNFTQRVGWVLRQHATQGEIGVLPSTALSESSWVATHASMHHTGGRDPITTLDAGVITSGTIASARLPVRTGSIGLVIDGGGSAITTGLKAYLEVPFACTIKSVTLLADVSGSIVIDIWKDTYGNFPPVVADSITASAKPTLSGTKSQDTTLTGWTTSVAAGDTLAFNVDSVATVTKVNLSLKVEAV